MSVVINGTNGITNVNGTAAAPAITGTDTDTGMYFGTNTLALSTGGTAAVTVDSSQNVGIGTTSPAAKLSVASGNILAGTANAAANGGGWDNYVAVNNSGATAAVAFNLKNGTYETNIGLNSSWAFGVYDATAAAYRMQIDHSGNLLVGTTSALGSYTSKVHVLGTGSANDTGIVIQSPVASGGTYAYMERFLNSSGTQVGYISSSGSATSYATSSDYRLKENIAPMTGALSAVAQLKPVTYTWKSTGEATQGFIAHELQEVVPECVTGEKDAVDADGNPVYQGIDTSFLIATLTAAIQELKAEVDALKAAR